MAYTVNTRACFALIHHILAVVAVEPWPTYANVPIDEVDTGGTVFTWIGLTLVSDVVLADHPYEAVQTTTEEAIDYICASAVVNAGNTLTFVDINIANLPAISRCTYTLYHGVIVLSETSCSILARVRIAVIDCILAPNPTVVLRTRACK